MMRSFYAGRSSLYIASVVCAFAVAVGSLLLTGRQLLAACSDEEGPPCSTGSTCCGTNTCCDNSLACCSGTCCYPNQVCCAECGCCISPQGLPPDDGGGGIPQ